MIEGVICVYEKFYAENIDLIRGLSWRFKWVVERDPIIEMEDLYQEAFIALAEVYPTYTGSDEAWGAFAFVVLKYRFTKMICRKKGEYRDPLIGGKSLDETMGEDDDLSLGDMIVDDSIRPFDETIIANDLISCVRSAISALDHIEQRIITMFYYSAMTGPEIAERLRIKQSDVFRIREQAFHKLKLNSHINSYAPTNKKASAKRRGYL